ncbi:MAG: c-type cytochrome [Brevirhabdus sp.]
MFDTMTITKIIGGFCGALLLFLLANLGAKSIYEGGGHGGEHAAASYVIDTGEEDGGGDSAAEEVDFATVLAAADAEKGAKVFSKCKACHKVDGTDGTGPHLNGVVGRDIGSVEGFGYSGTLTELEGNWTPEALNAFLTNVKGYAPGTKMTFSGLKKEKDRANLIAYLNGL